MRELWMRLKSAYKHMKFGWTQPWNEFDQYSSILSYNQLLIKEWLATAPKYIVVTKGTEREVRELAECMRRLENDYFGIEYLRGEEDIEMVIKDIPNEPNLSAVDLQYKGVFSKELDRRLKQINRNRAATLKRFGHLMQKHILRLWW